jgi:dienelactone hydrolase
MGKKFFELGMLYKTAKEALPGNTPLRNELVNISKISEIAVKTKEKINKTKIIDVNAGNHKKYVLFAHGGGMTITSNHYQEMYQNLSKKIGIACPEYRGYATQLDKVKGMDLRKTMVEDVEAGVEYLLDKGIKEEDIIVVGYCGGCSTAIAAAAKNPKLKHLILMSPYTSFEYIPAADCFRTYLKHHKYKSFDLETIKNVEVPTTIVHIKGDRMLPFEAPLVLSQHAKSLDKFIVIQSDYHHSFNKTKIDKIEELVDTIFFQ